MAEEETPSEQLTESLWGRVLEFFKGIWESFWMTTPSTMEPFFHVIGTAVAQKFGDQGINYLNESLIKSIERLSIPEEIKGTISKVIADGDLGSLMLGYFVSLNYFLSYVGGHASVASELASHQWRDQYKPTLPDVASLILTMFRDPTKAAAVRDMLHKHGYTDANIDVLFAASKSIPAPDEMRSLFLRGEIDEATLNESFKKYGFSDLEIDRLKKLFYPIPAYPDLIRMAVREAFYPDYIEEYGLMEELPGEFVMWAGKQGLSEDWARKYWASHWELPSILRGYEMLHRGVIEDTDLDKLFMATDIMPWWRDKLKAISYHPLTRVDVRRVYRMGIIDRDQVFRTYLDLGYDEEKAEWLTLFTEMEQGEPDRDLSKAEVLAAYGRKILTRPETNQMLLDLGYAQNEVDVLISMKDYQEYKDNKAREMKRIEKFYMAGAYDANQVIFELGKLDLTGAEQDSILKLWDSQRLAKLRSPTKKDLDGLFSADIITEKQYHDEIKILGYPEKYITWFIAAVKQKVEE